VGSVSTTYTATTGCDSTVTVITTLLDSYNLTQNATSCNSADVGNVTTTYTATTGCDSTVTVITMLIDISVCDDNKCNTTDIFNEETCECEHTPITPPDCNDNNPATSDIYNAQTCECEHVLDKHYVLIPNAFSPNNDGVNDAFTVTAIGASYIQAFIYNRWGQLVYESNNSSVSWDGTYKGKLQEIGVYVYLVTITYEDGSSVIKKGNITLIN
jgi:gliding motility-associated-like protein